MTYEPNFEQDVIERLTRIESLANATNGRVTKLEGQVDAHEGIINRAKGVFWTAQLLWLVITAYLSNKFGGKQ